MFEKMDKEEQGGSGVQQGPELSIIVPTFNEVVNVPLLFKKIEAALEGVHFEIIVVDDNSPDGTASETRALARKDARVRCVHRIGRRGLSSACIEGFLASAAPYIAVIDADMQHDERILPDMLKAVRDEDYDLAIGSRYIDGGGFGSWEEDRIQKSQFATKLANFVTKVEINDPMSGFFLMKRELFEAAQPNLSSIGFKILLDIVVSSPTPPKFKEVAYEFREREFGDSKLDGVAVWEYLMLLADKTVGHIVPVRFFSFALVGGTGVGVHFLTLALCYQLFGLTFLVAQSAATLIAMTSNFYLNNLITYRDMRLKGWGLLRGWFTFVLTCSIGAVANVGIAGWMFAQDQFWVLSALAGILVGTIWNYAVSSLYTWRAKAS
ncbi:glycosyltransferase [Kordiimonas sp.]|uniref:glycosyltransferase n=1 Tax=Kordiimonas sp. TaxID=1970157 RepID=UPI003A946A3F